MKDFLGQELNIGDNCVCVHGSSTGVFYQSRVTGFTKQFVCLIANHWVGTKYENTATEKRRSDKIIKIDTILNNLNNEHKRGKNN